MKKLVHENNILLKQNYILIGQNTNQPNMEVTALSSENISTCYALSKQLISITVFLLTVLRLKNQEQGIFYAEFLSVKCLPF